MAETRPQSEKSGRGTSTKLAISLPRDLAEAARGAAQAHRSPSLSAFIAEAIEEKLERDRLDEVLAEIFGDEPLTDEERACMDVHFFKR
jgi:hypothetical protein